MEESQNWTEEFIQSFRELEKLYSFLEWDLPPHLLTVAKTYPIFVPVRLARLIKDDGPDGALARQFLPSEHETNPTINQGGFYDPIGDKEHFVAPQLIHRYSSRALFAPTTICPVNCRYCFRKNEISDSDEIFRSSFEKTLDYLNHHSEVNELIFTGGDPLNLSNEKLQTYLDSFSKINHIKDIRFHSRYPIIIPSRINEEFISILQKFSKIFRTISIVVHINHEKEVDNSVMSALSKLSRLNIQLLSQTVLLNRVNNHTDELYNLFNKLIELKVRPYYLHHPDRVKGGMHFYLPLKQGREIFRELRNLLPGWALPNYVIDIPGGHGKVSAYNPETTEFSGQLLPLTGAPIKLQEAFLLN